MNLDVITRGLLRIVVLAALFFGIVTTLAAVTGGSISGTIKDQTGAVIPNVSVTVRNVATGVEGKAQTNTDGFYAFPSISVGQYEIDVTQSGFEPYKRTGLVIDINTQLQVDIDLQIGKEIDQVVVTQNGVQVETESTQMGDVVSGPVITEVGLNGRSFTDLLELQPGIVPTSTQTPDSVVMAGVTVAITPSGDLNPGNQSISGQREDANGFLVNGSDVKELMNGGTAIVPDLDSLSEFRVLTSNFDAEFGNYAGGIVNVVTKSGTDSFHGNLFEFLRNTDFDARSYFSPTRESYQQNQFGGTLGGPIKKGKLFFFGDYQGTRTVEGLDTGVVTVPSLADRGGNLSDMVNELAPRGSPPFTVAGAGLAAQLQSSLGYAVTNGEPFYYMAGEPIPNTSPVQSYGSTCTATVQCVFPTLQFPISDWATPAQNLLQYIPKPNLGTNTFSATADERLRDDKWSFRVDENSMRWGDISAYYFFDDYREINPYPSGQGGATIPGFQGINHGRAQLISLGDTKAFGTTTVNEAHVSWMRARNIVGQPDGGLGPSYASQGFVTGARTAGIYPLAPAITGVENLVFQGVFVMGLPITNVAQANNTLTASDAVSKVFHSHTIKAGFASSFEGVNMAPDAIFNGTFVFNGYQTGNDFLDYMVGAPNQFNQQDSQHYFPRHRYAGWYGQDSWRIRPDLNLNYGMRLDLMRYWSEKYNQVPTFIPGEQSEVFPNAFPGLVYVSDKGVPSTLVPERIRYAPRIGLAYSPSKSTGLLSRLLGGAGQTSIRASYGIFNTIIEGNSIGVDEPQPPYGLSGTVYNGLFATPYDLADGTQGTTPYPIPFPPLNASVKNPNSQMIFNGVYNPQSGMTAPVPWDTYPYTESYFFSFERQLPGQSILNLTYVGAEGHHEPLVYSANPGIPALCQSLNAPGVLADNESCGPGGENNEYDLAKAFSWAGTMYPAGAALQGTRLGLNPALTSPVQGNYFGNDDYQGTIGNSAYNALEASWKKMGKTLTYALGYTYSQSIDQASSLSDAVDPFNYAATRALSAWDLKHNFVATYDYRLPLSHFSGREKYLLQGWEISGITRVATGFPVTLSTDGDNSLQGSSPNGVNNRYIDLPDFTGQPLDVHSNPKTNGLAYFNPGAFQDNAIGTIGDARRRYFFGPGMFNTDLSLLKNVQLAESKTLQFRLEAFNIFNHTQFFGPAAVNGDVDNAPLFGHVVDTTPPRLMQLALKFAF